MSRRCVADGGCEAGATLVKTKQGAEVTVSQGQVENLLKIWSLTTFQKFVEFYVTSLATARRVTLTDDGGHNGQGRWRKGQKSLDRKGQVVKTLKIWSLTILEKFVEKYVTPFVPAEATLTDD